MSGFECASIFVGHSGLVNKAIGTFHEWAKFCCFNIVNCEMVHIGCYWAWYYFSWKTCTAFSI